MKINPKLLAVIVVVLVIVFVVVTAIGVTRPDDGTINPDIVQSLGSQLADTFLSGVAIDMRDIKIAQGEDTDCLNKVTRKVTLSQDATCEYVIAPSSASVRNLSLNLITGRCVQVVLDNADEDALRSELYIVDEDAPQGLNTNEGCADPNEPKLAIFEKGGDILTISCIDAGEDSGCVVELNPKTDKDTGA